MVWWIQTQDFTIWCNSLSDSNLRGALAQVAQWWACKTHNLVVLSLIARSGKLSFRRIFATQLCWSMWEKQSVALERKLCYYWCEKAMKHMCFTIYHDMILAVKLVLNPNQPIKPGEKAFKTVIALNSLWAHEKILVASKQFLLTPTICFLSFLIHIQSFKQYLIHCLQNTGHPPIIKSWSKSIRSSVKFHSKCEHLMTWCIISRSMYNCIYY